MAWGTIPESYELLTTSDIRGGGKNSYMVIFCDTQSQKIADLKTENLMPQDNLVIYGLAKPTKMVSQPTVSVSI